jgi:hypothetical protein
MSLENPNTIFFIPIEATFVLNSRCQAPFETMTLFGTDWEFPEAMGPQQLSRGTLVLTLWKFLLSNSVIRRRCVYANGI